MDVLARQLDAFVEAWETTAAPPDLKPFLPESGEIRRLTLVELIKVDLEYRWLSRGCPKRISEYFAEFPELVQNQVPCDLIYEEFHIRKQSGQQVDAEEYLHAFPGHTAEIASILNIEQAYETTAFFRRAKQQRVAGVAAGDTIDDFELLSELGAGAFAKVFLAKQKSMQRTVAVKISADEGTEPQTLAQLDHDHIVRVYDQRTLPDRKLRLLYMQYIAGGTLQQVIERVRQIPPEERTGEIILDVVDEGLEKRGDTRPTMSPSRHWLATATWPEAVCWIGSRLARGLDYAHRRGVLHRDVKPANVLLTAEPSPKLADFNISFSAKVTGATPGGVFRRKPGVHVARAARGVQFGPRRARPTTSTDEAICIRSAFCCGNCSTGYRPFSDDNLSGGWSSILDTMVERRTKGVDLGELAKVKDCPSGLGDRARDGSRTRPRPALDARIRSRSAPGAVHRPESLRAPLSAETERTCPAAWFRGCRRAALGGATEHRGERISLRAQRLTTHDGAVPRATPAVRAHASYDRRHRLRHRSDRLVLSQPIGPSGPQTKPGAGIDDGSKARRTPPRHSAGSFRGDRHSCRVADCGRR